MQRLKYHGGVSLSFELLIFIAILLGLLFFALRFFLQRETVNEAEFALLYKNGVYDKDLDPGAYWVFPMRDKVERLDKREQFSILSGQEILTKDRIAMKISVVVSYSASDPRKILSEHAYPDTALLEDARLELRRAIAELSLDDVLEARSDLGQKLRATLDPGAAELGYSLTSVEIRDVMLPNNLKRAYAGVLEAQKDAERRLEQARGEQAVMRSLANSAKLLEKNPALAQARMLQALDAGGNTIMFGASDVAMTTAKDED